MAIDYTPSTEKVARSYERTAQMVPNLGVSALSVVNGSVKVTPSMDAAATLASPLAGTHLRRNSMYSVHTRRGRGGMKIRINRRRSSRRLHSNVNYAIMSNGRRSRRMRSNRRHSRRMRSNRRHSRRMRSNRRRLSRNVNYVVMNSRRRSRRRGGL